MKILIAPMEFKGTLTAAQAAQAMVLGLERGWPGAEWELAPLADGGPGTVDAFLTAMEGVRRECEVLGPLGRPVRAGWGLLKGGQTAVIEMAAASGLLRLAPFERDPLRASSFGTGQLIANALDAGCRHILLGLGGSATNDGGAGAAAALGVRLLTAAGAPIDGGGAGLAHLARIDVDPRDPRLSELDLELLSDVKNPLLGPQGASAVFGPQKGADEWAVQALERALRHFESIVRSQLGKDLAMVPGAGAAGGLGYGLAALANGRFVPGFEAVSKAIGLEERIQRADWVLTGEGQLDAQTGYGKGPAALASVARSHQRPTVVFAGRVRATAGELGAFEEVIQVSREGEVPRSAALAAEVLCRSVQSWAKERLRLGRQPS